MQIGFHQLPDAPIQFCRIELVTCVLKRAWILMPTQADVPEFYFAANRNGNVI